MKKVKKFVSLLLAMIMLLSISSGISIIAEAGNEISTEKDYEFVYNSEGTITLTKYIGKSNEIVIPQKINGTNVTEIGEYVFKNCKNITNITISESIESFYFNAFEGCTNLAKLNVDKNNNIFDSRDNCNAIINTKSNKLSLGIKTTVIPDSVTSIGASAFKYTDCPEELVIPNSVTLIGNQAFYGCKNLKKLKLSDSLIEDSLHWEVFEGCSNLKSVILPKKLKSIGQRLFKDCLSLESIVLPKSIEHWQADVFEGCKNIKSITILNKDLNLYRTEDDSPEIWGETPDSIPKNAVIYGYKNSTAQKYAEKYDRKFIAIDEPIISNGTNTCYKSDDKNSVIIHCVYPIETFLNVFIDGKEVNKANYTVNNGSTIISFKPQFLETLSSGKHTVKIEFIHSDVTSYLTVEKSSNTEISNEKNNQQISESNKNGSVKSPSTGNNQSNAVLFASIIGTGGALVFISIAKKRIYNS